MPYECDEDPAFRHALAESMRDMGSNRGRTPQEDIVDLTGDSDDEINGSNSQRADVIDLDNDEDDDDLKRAIALSMQDVNSSQVLDETSNEAAKSTVKDGNPGHTLSADNGESEVSGPPPMGYGIPGFDRKKLEEERLARVAKRKAESSISPPPFRRDTKAVKKDASLTAEKDTSSATTRKKEEPKIKPPGITTIQPSSIPSPQFPKGVVKKTWAFGCVRDGNDIKIEEALQSADLELAVLSAFQWDMEWLFTKFRTRETKFLMVMQAKEESTKRQYEQDTASMPNIRLCFPPMDGQVNCMHSKLMLLFHPEYLRIVIPSANLVPYDWGEQGGIMENTVFIIDLPKNSDKDSNPPNTAFYKELVYFLKASTLHDNIVSKLTNFDFKETSRYAFVHTIGGSHNGDSWRRTGHCGLGRAVSSLGLRTHEPIKIDFVTSSIGSLTDEFMRSIYLSAQGDDGSIEYTLRTSKTFPAKPYTDNKNSSKSEVIQGTTGSEWKNNFQVYYPSNQTVSQSKGGFRNAGTICFQEKWYEGPKFPKKALHDCISHREGLLMHNKILFARPEKAISLPDGSSCAGWAYVGSANLSESAWGRIVRDRVTKEPKLNCRNWECGVLIPISSVPGNELSTPSNQTSNQTNEEEKAVVARKDDVQEKEKQNEKEEGKDIRHIFGDTIPVPMRVPAPSLGPALKPWYGAL